MRDEIVNYVNHWTGRADLPVYRLLGWLGLVASKFHDWKGRSDSLIFASNAD